MFIETHLNNKTSGLLSEMYLYRPLEYWSLSRQRKSAHYPRENSFTPDVMVRFMPFYIYKLYYDTDANDKTYKCSFNRYYF